MKFAHFSLFSVLVIFSACGQKEVTVSEVPLVRLTQVKQVAASAHTSYPAQTRAINTSNVAFRVSGTLADVKVKEGDYVREGQVIAVMDDRDYQVQLSATEAEYAQIKADCERVIALYNDGSTTAQNYDKARYGLEQITAKYQHAKDQLADCQLKSPFNGYVQKVLHEDHETVSAGMPIASLFCSNGLEVVINIPASEYMREETFDYFNVMFDVLPGKQFPLRLTSISQRANANQLYEVRFLLENKGENKETLKKVTPGMTALVDIVYKVEGNVPLEVPSSAVFHKGDQSYVFVYEGDDHQGTIRQVPVYVTALTVGGDMKVVSGIQPGQRVVECGVHHLSDGLAVRPNPTTSKENVGGLL